jgi:hypothetical protein
MISQPCPLIEIRLIVLTLKVDWMAAEQEVLKRGETQECRVAERRVVYNNFIVPHHTL